MPPRWMAKHEVCEKGWGCQETLILVDNGPQVYIVFNKGCTPVVDQDARITEHRAGPGLSVLSYTHVCRHQDNCNNLSTTLPLWTPPSIIGPGSLRCPVCLSIDDCKSAKELTCPAGSTHCYQGSIQFRGGGIFTILRVQGCMSQAGCNMLKGTREIGSIVVREDCSPKASLICEKGVNTYRSRGLSQMPINWNSTTNKICDPEEVCQETVLLVDAELNHSGEQRLHQGQDARWLDSLHILRAPRSAGRLLRPFLLLQQVQQSQKYQCPTELSPSSRWGQL
ncbi:ly6/PLAUR domain-containing protein 3 isoform X6 [Hyaena hyaena]|uniref:ly6/PLAUR domain-containing protein 3 isoform X6 n=1 Tax=Hyaena hyaena TaxID=95912 RepID=UPI001923E6CE|nr:ly6/PLAUR domain-containing protein 3 isoform X6 [Hyaena hyaena]